MTWKVIDTPMYPARWHVVPEPPYRPCNATHNFFQEKEDAEAEAKRRNNKGG